MPRNVACAAIIAGGVTAAVCSVFAAAIAFVPPGSASILGDLLYIEISSLPSTVTAERLFAVCVGWTLGAASVAAFLAWLCGGALHQTGMRPARAGVRGG